MPFDGSIVMGSVPGVPIVNATVKVSSSSMTSSPLTATVIVWVSVEFAVAPPANISVPATAVKSLPLVAELPDTEYEITSLVVEGVALFTRVTVKTKLVVPESVST